MSNKQPHFITTQAELQAAQDAGACIDFTAFGPADGEPSQLCTPVGTNGWVPTRCAHSWVTKIEAGDETIALRARYPLQPHDAYMAASANLRDEE